MADLILHDLDPEVVEGLRQRAETHGRSLEGEARIILEDSLKLAKKRAQGAARRIREGFGRRIFGDSAELIREDRDR